MEIEQEKLNVSDNIAPDFDPRKIAMESMKERISGNKNSPETQSHPQKKIEEDRNIKDTAPDKQNSSNENEIDSEKEQDKESLEKEEDIELLKKRYYDNQAYARDSNKRLSYVKNQIKELIDEGSMDEEKLSIIFKSLEDKKMALPEDLQKTVSIPKNDHAKGIFDDTLTLLTPDLWDQYLEVSDDSEAEKKVAAFDRLVKESSIEDQRKILEKIVENNTTPMKILKSMLAIGEEFLKSGYGDYISAGGFKAYVSGMNDKLAQKQKEIDRLTKKMREYEGNFDKPPKLTLGSSDSSGGDKPERDFDARASAMNSLRKQGKPS